MPKTKFQSFVFAIIMVFCMVYSMTVYSISLKEGALKYSVFGAALKEMWIEYIIVFLLIFFLISKNALRLANKFIDNENSAFKIPAVQTFTVLQIVPTITLIATFLHNGATSEWFIQWITSLVQCFPMAYCLQLFLIGPFVRFIFRCIFQNNLAKQPA